MGRGNAKMVVLLGFAIFGVAIALSLLNTLLSMTLSEAILLALTGLGGYVLGKHY